jgi:hypothetical protein
VEAKGCANDTRLAAAEPLAAYLAVSRGGAVSAIVHAFKRLIVMISSLGPTSNLQHEGVAAGADDGEGAVVQRMEWRHGTAAADPDQAGREELGR